MTKTVVFENTQANGFITIGEMELVRIYIDPANKNIIFEFDSDLMKLSHRFIIADARIGDMYKNNGFEMVKKMYAILKEYPGFVDIPFLEKKVGRVCDELMKWKKDRSTRAR